MFNLGFTEVLLIAGAALLVFGPTRLPELAKGMGKGIRDFKKALNGEHDAEEKESLPGEKKTVETESPDHTKDGHGTR